MSVLKITDIKHPASADANIILFEDGTTSIPGLLVDDVSLGDLSDVDTTGVQNESVLSFDSGADAWVPKLVTDLITAIPTGTITMFGSGTAPSGWLNCDGAAVSRATYSDLFGVLGTAYGAGNGSTTFNLPDLRLKFPRGVGSGSAIGAAANNNVHGHTVNVADGNHAHTHTVGSAVTGSVSGNFSGNSSNEPNHSHSTNTFGTGSVTTGNTPNHNHSVSIPSAANAGGASNTGTVGNTTGQRVNRDTGTLTTPSVNHTHSTPNHSHNVSQTAAGEHAHNQTAHNHSINEGGGGEHSHSVSGSISGNFNTNFNTTSGAASSATHSHTASSGDGDNIPAYVTVGYIIKT